MSVQVGVLTRLKFLLAEKMFYSSVLRQSRLRHQWILRLFKDSAEGGHLKALSIYGRILYLKSFSPIDKGQGINYLLEAAKLGDSEAQFQVARIYEQGHGHLPKSSEQAVRWYVRAAEQEHPEACHRLTRACAGGELGLAVNPEQSRYWQQKVERVSRPLNEQKHVIA